MLELYLTDLHAIFGNVTRIFWRRFIGPKKSVFSQPFPLNFKRFLTSFLIYMLSFAKKVINVWSKFHLRENNTYQKIKQDGGGARL